jgi:hypothetical protein
MKTIDRSKNPEDTTWEVVVANHDLENRVIQADNVDDMRKTTAVLISAAFIGGLGTTLGLISSDFATANKISAGIAAGILFAGAVKAYSK